MVSYNRSSNAGEYLTIMQACELTNLGQTTVRRIANEAGASRKIGRCYRIHKNSIMRYIDENY